MGVQALVPNFKKLDLIKGYFESQGWDIAGDRICNSYKGDGGDRTVLFKKDNVFGIAQQAWDEQRIGDCNVVFISSMHLRLLLGELVVM